MAEKTEMDAAPKPPTLTRVTLTLEWSAPADPEFPVKGYYVSVRDNQGNLTNYPVPSGDMTYTLDVPLDKDDLSFARIGVTYVIGPAGLAEKSAAFNVEPTT
ncbi:hypothetical protein GGD81_003180 [Rhodobium orientis]|uniref:Fibronectin type-III domain-containing protein n=1 Tax=Rhodobium orientis TaxID=34017 RepID=A0A327JJB1_9HYPH|nr:hypothetical protein [Rhodobium orientis]MBB4304124.1 hypothetical protein [Rhodobium orientis]MBK5948633.1 hypothetical protein [Rhodobium orientis]RAI24892.1 hypothetical protein CH339_20690 [Rhodobium orientis]